MCGDGEDAIPNVEIDPYMSLAERHKLGYVYSFHTDFYGVDYLVREIPRNMYFSGCDPNFKTLNDPAWFYEECTVEQKFTFPQVADPNGMIMVFTKQFRGIPLDKINTLSKNKRNVTREDSTKRTKI